MNASYFGTRELRMHHPVRQPPRRTTLYRSHEAAAATSRDTALREPILELHENGDRRFHQSRHLDSNANRYTDATATFNIGAGLQNERTEPTMADDDDYSTRPNGPGDLGAAVRRQSVRSILDARRPAPVILAERLAAESLLESSMPADERERHLQREARRRTIYVPDDTTVMTIHPGASLTQRAARRGSVLHQSARRKSQALPNETHPIAEPMPVENHVVARPTVRDGAARNVRRTSIAGPPKRIHKPIRDLGLPTLNEDSPKRDQSAAASSGVPLNHGFASRQALGKLSTNRQVHQSITKLNSKDEAQTEQLLKKRAVRMSLAPMHARKGSGDRSHTSLATKVVKALSSSDGALPEREQIKHRSHHPSIAQPKANEQPAASLGSGSTGKVCGDAFAVLTDDLEHPQLYEDKWLDHQEIALTQLLNAFFDAAAVTSQVDHTHKDLRSAMINLYNDQEIVNLVKRLQASLIYGSLSVPQEVMARNIRLTDDVGQRRRFLNIFLDAYNLPLLRAAAEAIIGRQCSRSSRTSSESASGPEREIVSKRELEEFLDAFVVRHEDVDASKAGPGTVTSLTKEVVEPVGTKTWAWRKTVVRSLMLVLLLDKAKSSKTTKWCLFQASSDLKSSEAVIKALGEILLPSYGDLMRPLRHLRYDISVNQHPLEEFNYKVENIATDLRDGIRLTKVVEILLDECRRVSGSDAVPSLTESLKLPCISRTQKLQNVMIALGAVVRLKSIPEAILKETTAFDIVDGHREKTLSLLWALLGQYSVDCLIDWNLLRAEYDWAQSQLSGGSLASNHIATTDLPVTTIEESWSLLTHWAKSLATLDGVQITNLTTSFADGRAFTAIIKAYLPYLPSTPTPHSSASSSPAAALRTLGCTPSFTALLSSPRASIPTRDFTLAALTFLAARLLPAARSHRAASTIQRAYRARLARLTAHRRAVAMRLAAHCAAVVNARDRVVWAARVMQRAWRAVLAAKIGALEGDVRGFQALARGWLVRSRSSRRPKYARAGW